MQPLHKLMTATIQHSIADVLQTDSNIWSATTELLHKRSDQFSIGAVSSLKQLL